MKTLLVLSPHPDFAESLRTGMNPEQYRVVHRVTLEEAEPLLTHGLVQACVVDLEIDGGGLQLPAVLGGGGWDGRSRVFPLAKLSRSLSL